MAAVSAAALVAAYTSQPGAVPMSAPGSSTVSTPAATSSSPTSPTPTSPASTLTTVTAPSTSASQRPAGLVACTGRDMVLGTAQGGGGHAGSGDFLLVFTNRGTVPCTLHGYPRVVAVQAGRVVRQAQPTPRATPVVVLAAQGGRAAADLNIYNLPLRPSSAPCGSATDVILHVTPPGTSVTFTLTEAHFSTCDEAIQAVQPASP